METRGTKKRKEKEDELENVKVGRSVPANVESMTKEESKADLSLPRKVPCAENLKGQRGQMQGRPQRIVDIADLHSRADKEEKHQVSIYIGHTQPLPPRDFFNTGGEQKRRALCSTCTMRWRCIVHIPCGCIITCEVCTTEGSHCVSCCKEIETKIKVAE